MAFKMFVESNTNIGGSIAFGSSRVSLQFVGELSGLIDFINTQLGYSTAGDTVQRTTPETHPLFTSMYATSIGEIVGMGPIGTMGGNDSFSDFNRVKVTVNYEAPTYLISQAGGPPPHGGYLILTGATSAEFIQRRVGQFQWPPESPMPAGAAITGALAQVLCKTKLNWKWLQIPATGLFKQGIGASVRPINIERALGRLNVNPFGGYPAQTLLLESYVPNPVSAPMGTIPGAGGFLYYDVDLVMSYFDPEPLGSANKRGHNLVPCPADGKWYRPYLKVAGATDTENYWQYQTYDYDQIFRFS